MSKRKKGRAQQSTESLRSSVQRDLDRGNLKEALKNARVIYRKDASEKNRLLLQQACLARAEQLHQNNLLDQARDTLQDFTGLGPVPPPLQSRFNRLRVLLGISSKDCNGTHDPLADDPALRTELADQAVLQGPAPSLPSDLRRQVEQVRETLKLIESDQAHSEALALPAIDRRSPLADWKLFARGLAAFYAGEDARAVANWQRLDPARPPHRIAQALLLVGGLISERDASPATKSRARQLAQVAGNGSLANDLRAYRRSWEAADWPAIVRQFGRIADRYGASNPDIVRKLGEILSGRLVKEERWGEVRNLARKHPGPPSDPKLNRVQALLAEEGNEWLDARKAWLAFLEDLQKSPLVTAGDRTLAVGLVYQRIATNTSFAAQDCEDDYYIPWRDEEEESLEQLKSQAIGYFEASLQHAPQVRETYLLYAATLKQFEEPASEVDRVFRRLIEQFPDDVDALLTVARHYLDEQQPAIAKQYATKALRLQPREERVRSMMWWASVATARLAARRKEFGVARAELDEAEQFSAPGRDRYVVAAYRAAIEFKAGNIGRAEEFLQAAVRQFDQPAVGILIVSAQAFRVGVSREVRKDLNTRVKKALAAAKKTSQAAGVMAQFFNALERTETKYQGIRTHLEMVTKYLKACRRIRWDAKDLIAACEFLSNEPDRLDTYMRFAEKGLKQFPLEPYFHYTAGKLEMMKGPARCDRVRAQAAFERAIDLSKTAERPLDEIQRQEASRALGLLQQSSAMPEFDFFTEDEDDEDIEEESDLEDFFAAGGFSQVNIDELIASMPPDVRRTFETVARKSGRSVSEILDEVLTREMEFRARQQSDSSGGADRRSRRRGRRRKSRT